MFRRRVVEEDTLINQRMSWMIWSEALLLAAWSGTFIKELDPNFDPTFSSPVGWILFGASAFGCVIAFLSAIGVASAQLEIRRLRKLYERQFPEVEQDLRLPKITGARRYHILGHFVPYIVPAGFLFLQGMMFYLSNHPPPHH